MNQLEIISDPQKKLEKDFWECDFTIWNPNLHFRHVSGFTKGTRPDLLAQASPGSGRVEASQAS